VDDCRNGSRSAEICSQILNELRERVENLQIQQPNNSNIDVLFEEIDRLQVRNSVTVFLNYFQNVASFLK